MREAALPLSGRARRSSWTCGLLAAALALAAVSPSLAASGKRSRRSASRSSAAKVTASSFAPVLRISGTVDEQIDLLEKSADFWQRSGTSIQGADARTAWLLAQACREQALLLKARQAKKKGNQGEATRLVLQAEGIRRSWKRPAPAAGQGQMMTGMEGMAPGMEGMDPGMGMSGAPLDSGMDPGMGSGMGMSQGPDAGSGAPMDAGMGMSQGPDGASGAPALGPGMGMSAPP